MKPFAIPLMGMLAAGALIVADLFPVVRVVEASLVLELSKTNWGGSGRLWAAAALMFLATMAWALEARRWPAFLSGAVFGMLIDLGFSAWQWRDEQYARVKMVGFAGFEPTVQWQPGSFALAAAFVLVLMFFVKSAYPARPPAARKSAVSAPVAEVSPATDGTERKGHAPIVRTGAEETPELAKEATPAETAFWRGSL